MPEKRKLAEHPAWRSELSVDKVKCLVPVDLRQPLLSSRHIRLLKLYPPGWPDRLSKGLLHDQDSELHGDVYQASLDDLSRPGRALYAALSYVWGDPAPVRRTRCGNRRVGITKNLYDALLYVRHLDKPRLVWADSLCINQRNDKEKSEQVRFMHRIYTQAHVIAWVAHPGLPGHASFTFTLLRNLYDAAAQYEATIEPSESSNSFPSLEWGLINQAFGDFLKSTYGSIMTDSSGLLLGDARHYALSLLTASYFERLWTVQEFALGKTRCIQTDAHTMSVDHFRRATGVLEAVCFDSGQYYYGETRTHKAETTIKSYFKIVRPGIERQDSFTTSHGGLEALVWSFRSKLCRDPRDHIYALLALFPDSDNTGSYTVDYGATAATVFCDFTVRCIRFTNGFQALSYVRHYVLRPDESKFSQQLLVRNGLIPAAQETVGLPTWCPDWAGPDEIFPRSLAPKNSSVYGSGSKHWTAGGQRHVSVHTPSTGCLSVEGLEIARITACSVSFGDPYSTDSQTYPIMEWFRRIVRSCEGKYSSRRLCLALITALSLEARLAADNLSYVLGNDVFESLLDWNPRNRESNSLVSLIAAIYLQQIAPDLASLAGLSIKRRLSKRLLRRCANELERQFKYDNKNCRLFFTENGMLGSGYSGLCVGDLVCIFYGGKTPFILREVGNRGEYKLIGECFVDGLMYGAGTRMGLKKKTFNLM